MTVSNVQGTSGPIIAAPGATQAQNIHQLTKAVRTGNLEEARQAYADIVKSAPAGATWNPDSAFAQLGRDLLRGNMVAAKVDVVHALKDLHAKVRPTPTAESTKPVGSTGTIIATSA